MKLDDALEALVRDGRMEPARARALKGLEAGRPFSVHGELRALLYIGALFTAGGLGAVVKQYFDRLGPLSVLGGLAAVFLAAVSYCYWKGGPFSRERAPSPTIAFDYVLYLGCVAWGLAAAYAETRFHLLGGRWERHFLASAALFLLLSYRFDNRLVLSLGLSSLAAWLGLAWSRWWQAFWETGRPLALSFGALCGLAAWASERWEVKRHFQDVYGNFAAHFLLAALLSGTVSHKYSLYTLGLAAAAAALALHAVRSRKFFYMVYAALYGYAGASSLILDLNHSTGFVLSYFLISSTVMGAGLFVLARRFREEE